MVGFIASSAPFRFQGIPYLFSGIFVSVFRDYNYTLYNRPVSLLRNSILTPSLSAGIINWKYVNSVPITRLAKEFEQHDVHIPTQNMCNWAIQMADLYLKKVYDRMKGELPSYHVVHADEAPVMVNRNGRPAGSKSYMWV